MSAKAVSPSSRDQWRTVFPLNEAQRAAKFLRDTWEELVTTKPQGFRATLRENKLTEKLYIYLARTSTGKGRLTGFWINEKPDGELDDPHSTDPQIVKRIRKDITYASNLDNQRLELIFEFKKLSSKNSWVQYKGQDGMRRFVDGTYAKGLPLALMVGLVIGDYDSCLKGLKLSLQSKGSRDDLRMVDRDTGKYIFEPSTAFPSVAHFDTEHNRPADRAPRHGTMLLSHIFVTLPSDKT